MTTTLVNETCPAAVSEVTFVTNVFNLGTGDVNMVHEELTTLTTALTLSSVPVANSLVLFKNGVQIDSFTQSDVDITLDEAGLADDIFVAHYLPLPA